MHDVPVDLLERPADDAAGQVALRHLDEAVAAAARLSDRTDGEALHDFRVALRKLRATARAYAGLRDGVPKKLRRRLRKLSRATNAARDVETQIVWFRDRVARFTAAERKALRALRARLRARRRRARASTHLELQERFAKLERRVRRALTDVRAHAGADQPPFRAALAATLATHAQDLRKRLADTNATTPADLHATRIAAKRLRYLLEPVENRIPQAADLTGRLKQLQDILGGLTDAHELQGELRRSEKKDQTVGIGAAAGVLAAEVKRLFDTIHQDWSTAAPGLEKDVGAVVRHLKGSPKRAPPRAPFDRTRPSCRAAPAGRP